jgi:serine/threonine protein kinase
MDSPNSSHHKLSTALYKYDLAEKIGQGSFGVVRRGKNEATGEDVAIKQLVHICEDKGMIRRVLREVRIMHSLQHINVLALKDLLFDRGALYFVMELCCIDLYVLSYVDHEAYSQLEPRDFVEIMKQVLKGLQHMHSVGVVHRDIKPSNVLVNYRLEVKICDFGLSRQLPGATSAADSDSVATEEELSKECNPAMLSNVPMTPYVVTRWYRAPEILLTDGVYDCAQDVWAAACTFAEFAMRKPLFPGSCSVNQLRLIIRGIGSPRDDDLAFAGISSRGLHFLNEKRPYSDGGLAAQLARTSLGSAHPQFVQLLRSMLQFNPIHRLQCETALKLPIFNLYGASDATRGLPPAGNCKSRVRDAQVSFIPQRSPAPALQGLSLDDIESCTNSRGPLLALLRKEVETTQTSIRERNRIAQGDDDGKLTEEWQSSNVPGSTDSSSTAASGTTDKEETEETESTSYGLTTAATATKGKENVPPPRLSALSPCSEISESCEAGAAYCIDSDDENTSVCTVETEDSGLPQWSSEQLSSALDSPRAELKQQLKAPSPQPPIQRKGGNGLVARVSKLVASVATGTRKAVDRTLRNLDGLKD